MECPVQSRGQTLNKAPWSDMLGRRLRRGASPDSTLFGIWSLVKSEGRSSLKYVACWNHRIRLSVIRDLRTRPDHKEGGAMHLVCPWEDLVPILTHNTGYQWARSCRFHASSSGC